MRTACVLALGVLAAGVFGSDKVTATKQRSRALFLKRCSACHAPDRVFHREATRGEWREIVNRMRRMPQSGISPKDADLILDYLVSLRGAAAPDGGETLGGHRVFGRKRWLSIVEIRTATDGIVKIGGVSYGVEHKGRTVTLRRGKTRLTLSFRGNGKPGKTAKLDAWKVGDTTYEVHLVLYSVRGDRVRIGRAIRRRS